MNHLSRALAGAVLGSLVLVGCSGEQDSPGADPDPAASSSPSASEPETSVAAAEESTPTIAPASGKRIEVEGMQIKLPADWKPGGPPSSLQAAGWEKENPDSFVTLFRFTQVEDSLDQLTRTIATRSDWAFELTRRDDLAVDSQVVSHLSGRVNPGEYIELFATLRNQESLQLAFTFRGGETKAERDEIVQSVLATWEFTSPG